MKLIMSFSVVCCYFVAVRPRYISQYPILGHLTACVLPLVEGPIFAPI